jgi:hypothetical protein
MYPDNWRSFLQKYNQATAKPYGYLLIDLKQETPEDKRLVTNITNSITVAEQPQEMIKEQPQEMIKEQPQEMFKEKPQEMFKEQPQEVDNEQAQEVDNEQEVVNEQPQKMIKDQQMFKDQLPPHYIPHSCTKCGMIFPSRESRDQHFCNDEKEWQAWIQTIAEVTPQPEVVNELMKEYKTLLLRLVPLEQSELHVEVMNEIQFLMATKKLSPEVAIHRVLRNKEDEFQQLLEETEMETSDIESDEAITDDEEIDEEIGGAAPKHKSLLLAIASATMKQMKEILSHLTSEQADAVRDLVLNFLRGKISVDDKTLKSLSPYKRFLANIALEGIEKCQANKHCKVILKVFRLAKPFIKSL